MSKIPSKFSEAAYQSFIESIFLEEFRYSGRYDINFYSGADERVRGFDIEVETLIPIYLQLKVVDFYPQNAGSPAMQERSNVHHYNDDPGAYFFKLHLDEKNKDYDQHNLLVELCNDHKYARYLAPCFVSASLLQQLKYDIPRMKWNRVAMMSKFGVKFEYWNDYFMFDHSITIKPTNKLTKVPKVHHKYFFNRRFETSMHSETNIVSESNLGNIHRMIDQVKVELTEGKKEANFKTIFSNLLKAIYAQAEYKIEDEELVEDLNLIFEREEIDFQIKNHQELLELDPTVEVFNVLTKYLHERYRIITYLVSKSDKSLLDTYI